MTKLMVSTSVAGLISTAAYVSLSRLPGPVPLTHFFIALGIVTAAWAWAYWTVRCDAGATKWIVLWGLAYRLAAFFGQPLYEDDYFRHLWDGRATALGETRIAILQPGRLAATLLERHLSRFLMGSTILRFPAFTAPSANGLSGQPIMWLRASSPRWALGPHQRSSSV